MIVSLGGNDAFRGVPYDTAAANLTAIMGEIRVRAIPALLVGVEIPGIHAPALRYNRLWSEVAAAQDVPLYPNFYLGILRHLSTPFRRPATCWTASIRMRRAWHWWWRRSAPPWRQSCRAESASGQPLCHSWSSVSEAGRAQRPVDSGGAQASGAARNGGDIAWH